MNTHREDAEQVVELVRAQLVNGAFCITRENAIHLVTTVIQVAEARGRVEQATKIAARSAA
jgi:hypothetical protein